MTVYYFSITCYKKILRIFNMKKNYFFHTAILLTCCSFSHAQDVITFKNGTDLQVKVQEITPQEIRYKRFDNLNGPVITILRSTANAINYENGTVENLNEDLTRTATPVAEKAGYEVGDIVSIIYYDKKFEGEIYEINASRGTALVRFDNGRKTANRDMNELLLIKSKSSDGLVNQQTTTPSYYSNQQDQPSHPSFTQAFTKMFQQGEDDATRYYQGYQGAGTGAFVTSLLVGPILGLIPAIACSSTAPQRRNLGFPKKQLAENNDYYQGYAQQAKRIKSRKVWTNYGIGTGILLLLVVVTSAGK